MNNRKIAGIVAEYNPFHTGHEYQIKKVRELGYEKIICVMSGNTTQRGEFPIADKYSRARMALLSGADLVVELPYPYSSSGAEFFASAALRILASAGVDAICFGSECADLDVLRSAARVCESDVFAEKYKSLTADGQGSAAAYFEAYRYACAELSVEAGAIEGSNDLLGVAYIRAIEKNGFDITPVPIKREGSAYNDGELDGLKGHPSALMIRNSIAGGLDGAEKCMPSSAFDVLSKCFGEDSAPVNIKKIESAVLAFFRLSDAEALSKMNIAEAGGGLLQRLCKSAKTAKSYDELIELTSGKNYTQSRVRRVILAAMTGACEDDIRRAPAYSTVLGFNGGGRELLAAQRKRENGEVVFVTKPADAPLLSEAAARQSELSARADALFTLAKPNPSENGEYLLRSPVIM